MLSLSSLPRITYLDTQRANIHVYITESNLINNYTGVFFSISETTSALLKEMNSITHRYKMNATWSASPCKTCNIKYVNGYFFTVWLTRFKSKIITLMIINVKMRVSCCKLTLQWVVKFPKHFSKKNVTYLK